MSRSGRRNINGIDVLPLDGAWSHINGVAADKKLTSFLEYAGCEFHDAAKNYVQGHTLSLVGIGGLPIAYEDEQDVEIKHRLENYLEASRQMMGSSAAFSYLNIGEKPLETLYEAVMKLGHFSVAHTVQANFVVAGISEAAELELSLQRDVIHLSKLTNARTKIQNNPPLVVRHKEHIPTIDRIYKLVSSATEELRTDEKGDTLETVNGLYPVNKATVLMMSGSLNNLRKVSLLKDDQGKEKELREVASNLHEQLSLLWPEMTNKSKGE